MGKTEAKQTARQGSASAGAIVSLEELAREQGVTAVADLDEVGALWPTEDDPAAFLKFIEAERAERRVKADRKRP